MHAYIYSDITLGMAHSKTYVLSQDTYNSFLRTFGDTNPLHVDDNIAQANGFKKRIAHGAILNGFLSQFVGMEFPGANSILQSVTMRYHAPCYIGDILEFHAAVTQKVDAVCVIVMNIRIINKTQNCPSAAATVQMGMLA